MKKLLFALLLMAGSYAIAQNQNSSSTIDSLKRRVIEDEKKLTSREKELDEIHFKVNLIHGIATNAEDIAIKTERNLWVLGFNWFSGIFAIIGSLIGFFGIRKYMGIKAKERIDEHLKDPKWTKALEEKIIKHLAENELKEKINILVISKDDESENVIKNYFSENDFSKNRIKYIQGTEIDFNNTDFDILFINNKDNKFNLPVQQPRAAPFVPTDIDSLIEKIKNSEHKSKNYAVFYFNDNQSRFPDHLDNGLNSSFTNSLASLYHNLLDLMRYKYVVLDRRNFD